MTSATCPIPDVVEPDVDVEVPVDWEPDLDDAEGWQALAHATLGRPLTRAEAAAVERLPVHHALDLLFPDLTDAARQEALWALG